MFQLLPEKKINIPPVPFATDWQAVIFRNYGMVKNSALASVLKTDEQTIVKEAERLGLEGIVYNPKWKEKGYISLIKNNWHLLDYKGICTLTEMTESQLAKTLFEDDFLFVKVGNFKPEVTSPVYSPLTAEEIVKTEAQAKIVRENRSKDRVEYFDFFKNVPKVESAIVQKSDGLKMVYNYNEIFGDNLLTGDFSAYSDEMLKSLSQMGINALWKHVVLYDLVGLPFDERYGEGWEIRLENLKKLCDKLEKYGIKIWLYLNEPRALPLSFFDEHPELLGVYNDQVGALCTSMPEVQQYLYDGVKKIVERVPNLGGFFSITASENLTNCFSRIEYDINQCPRCKNRTRDEVCDEINATYLRALKDANSSVKLIAWTWGWSDHMGWNDEETMRAIRNLPQEIGVMCVSEEGLIIHGDDGDFKLFDYSISQIGPSEHTKQIFKEAKDSGHKTIAKMQVNNTWECSCVPYIPCFELVWKHFENLKEVGVDGYMLGWSLGGYPSFNLSLASQIQSGGSLEEWYQRNFGEEWETVRSACEKFSEGFLNFPFSVSLAYDGPTNIGVANPFYEEKTGIPATMVGFPYDDLECWRAIYKRETFVEMFNKLNKIWKEGLDIIENVQSYNASCVKRMANACYCVFRSTYLQSRWIMENDPALAEEEFANVCKMIEISAQDATLGYEATNHYLYTENMMLEKLLGLDKILQKAKK